jgi:hypothetical protein
VESEDSEDLINQINQDLQNLIDKVESLRSLNNRPPLYYYEIGKLSEFLKFLKLDLERLRSEYEGLFDGSAEALSKAGAADPFDTTGGHEESTI